MSQLKLLINILVCLHAHLARNEAETLSQHYTAAQYFQELTTSSNIHLSNFPFPCIKMGDTLATV